VSKATIKRGRPLGSKDKNPQKWKGAKNQGGQIEEIIIQKKSPEGNEDMTQEETKVPNSSEDEISLNYAMSGKIWNRDKVIIDDAFAYNLALEVMDKNKDQEPHSVEECKGRKDWPKWNDTIQAELNSLAKQEVFGPVTRIPNGVKPVGYKWVFVRKRNEKGEITRYKTQLVAQGFFQRARIDYEETYSPMMDATTFRYLISLAMKENLDLCLMDVVTAYLYGSLDSDIYMKLPKGFKLPGAGS